MRRPDWSAYRDWSDPGPGLYVNGTEWRYHRALRRAMAAHTDALAAMGAYEHPERLTPAQDARLTVLYGRIVALQGAIAYLFR